MTRATRNAAVLLVTLLVFGCGGRVQMSTTGEAPVIKQDEATVIFMRSSKLGSMVAASLFDVSGPDTVFIGILHDGTKIAHSVKPGEYTFMVMGESADFMQATVLPERTYYAQVTPRMGVWKARFSFRPMRRFEIDGAEFWRSFSSTQFVSSSPEARSWAAQHAAEANALRAQYWPEWTSKPEHQRASQTLRADDGKAREGTAAVAALAAPAATPPTPSTPPAPAPPSPPAIAPTAALSTSTATSPAGSPFPRQGDTWTYRFTDSRSGKAQNYSVMVSAVTEAAIFERFHLEGGAGGDWTHGRGGYVAPLGPSLFSPYFSVFEQVSPGARLGRVPVTDASCKWPFTCEAQARIVGPETVKVAAGTFETVKVVVEQTWRSANHYQGVSPSRQLVVWYSPAVKRAVKFSSRPTFDRPPIEASFDLELTSYRLQ